MKGSVFIALNDMIEQQLGLKAWLEVLDEAGLEGAYTATATYDDQEIFTLVGILCKKLNMEAPVLLHQFGVHLFDCLHRGHTAYAESQPDFFAFINSIHGVIHVEVHKLDEDARPPSIKVVAQSEGQATLRYESDRKLCHLAEGLLEGAARLYGLHITTRQSLCMHEGADHCLIEVVVQ